MTDRCRAILTAVLVLSCSAAAMSATSRPATSRAATTTSGPTTRDREARGLQDSGVGGVEGRPVGPGTSDLGGWVRTLGALAVVVVLIFVVRLLLRRFAPARTSGALPGAIEVVARSSLSSRHRLYLVRLGQRLVLVGSGPEGLATLSEVTDPDEVSRLSARAGAAVRPGGRAGKADDADKSPQVREDES